MYNKFKIYERVIVNGVGKFNEKHYVNAKGIVICRDPYFKDYNIKFEDGTEDWLEGIYLKSIDAKKKRRRKKKRRNRK